MEVRIARFHNIFGPEGTWGGGKEKVSAAMCRKVAETADGGEIEIWGDGEQTRTFLYIDECIEGVLRLTRSRVTGPLNIGSDERVTVNQLAQMVIDISGKKLTVRHVLGPQGVRGRCSDNEAIFSALGWRPSQPLIVGLEKTYAWVKEQVDKKAETV
jgi:nucleoside-diphosphate-sugar epimerase